MHGGLYARNLIITKTENKNIQSTSILKNKWSNTPKYITAQKTKKAEAAMNIICHDNPNI